jgi:hypothetical protein
MGKPKSDSRRRSLSDPLAAALLPPPNETPLEREKRLNAEFQAKQVSDGIDEMIRKERFEKKKTKVAEVKVLLLGQSESGKSTTLKRESSPTPGSVQMALSKQLLLLLLGFFYFLLGVPAIWRFPGAGVKRILLFSVLDPLFCDLFTISQLR